MEEEKRPEWENVQPNETVKTKKTINTFVIKYIIFVIILIAITAIGIYFTIKNIDNNNSSENQIIEESNNESDDEVVEEEKRPAEDSKYGIKSYSETYNTNSLEIKYYYDIDGKITTENEYSDHKTKIEFIQINGLKNKEIQDKINAKLKNVPYSLDKEKYVSIWVRANFSNVLSVEISNDISYKDIKSLNFDLTTGNEITFENLFVSSAPIKSMIAGAMYEDFAWNKLYEDYEGGSYDMENADTSEIEEEILLRVNKYDKIRDEIRFSFSPTSIYIYNPELGTTIDMFKYANEIAIYKRYLTEESIYENDDLGTKGVIVFTEDTNSKLGDGWEQISYGKISDNIFVEEVLWIWDDHLQEQDKKTIISYINNLSTENKTILKQETSSDKGVIFQASYSAYKDEKDGYYCISVSYSKAECTLTHFKNEAFKDYIQMKSGERADVGLNKFETYMQDEYPEMNISDEWKTYYLSLTGEFLGNTIEEVKSKVWE